MMTTRILSVPGTTPFEQLVQEALRLISEIGLGCQSPVGPTAMQITLQEMLVVQDPWLDWIDTH